MRNSWNYIALKEVDSPLGVSVIAKGTYEAVRQAIKNDSTLTEYYICKLEKIITVRVDILETEIEP